MVSANKSPANIAHNRLDISGVRFGRLIVIEFAGIRKFKTGNKSEWHCKCDCGSKIYVLGSSLTSGNTLSCGCIANELITKRNKTHGKSDTSLYRVWQGMLNRCRNSKQTGYENYGGRGIRVCDKWNKFEFFMSDMGFPLDGQSIERINNDGNYEPGNCRWAYRIEQSRNKRSNRIITYKGTSMTLIEWSEKIGIEQSSLRERLEKWPLEIALTTPRKGKQYAIIKSV